MRTAACLLLVSSVALVPRASACPTAEVLTAAINAASVATATRDVEAGNRWQNLLTAAAECPDPTSTFAVLAARTDAAMRLGDSAQGAAAERERHALAAQVGDRRVQADAATRLGSILSNRAETDLAQRRLQEAAGLWSSLGETLAAADVRSRLSRLHRRDGDYLQALREELEALRLRRLLQTAPGIWRSILNIAVLYEQLEQFDEARRRYAEALDEAERSGNEQDVAVVLSSFAGFLNDLDVADAAQAKAMAERALSIEQRSGRAVQIAGALMQLGRAELGLQHLDSSDTHFRDAWRQASSVSHEAMLAHVGFRWGELAFAQGNTALALQRLEAARRAYETQGNRHRLAKVQQQLEKVYLASGDPLAAARAGREHYRLRDALLGGPAIARIGELLRQFEVDEERLRNAQLQREKAETELRLSVERRKFQNFSIAALMVASVLLLFGWRHFTVERLYRVLRERNRVVQEQAEQLRLANVQLTEQTELLYRSSITDALTGVANRRRGMQVLEASTAETAAGRPAFAVLVIDIDHFKQINDTLGHPVGDQALKSLADLLQHALPPAATLARMGGEEFMVILPDTALEAAHGIAEDLRQQAAAMSLRTDRGARSLTISIGVAIATPGRTSASARMLYASADAALYAAKRDGRNRVVIA